MSGGLERYISDNCIQFFGLADRSIVEYVLASASSCKTPEALLTSLTASGLPDNAAGHAFVNEVFQRAPRKHKHKSGDGSRRHAEKEAKALKNQQFSLLLDDDQQA
ncbi:hypothetical protein MPER_16235, partial [Moniliophthora perniciosa FA553]